jgi:branched-chain amino acid transport system substrate-binding protein
MKFKRTLIAVLAAASLSSGAWGAPDVIKIGFINTLSGPAAAYGEEMLNAYQLALEERGGKLGGIPVDLIVGDDQSKPQVGIQQARQMIERDGVHLISGLLASHVTEAVNSVVLPTGKLVMAIAGGSSALAGENCRENFFVAAWNTDTMFEAIGARLAEQGAERVSVIATNYQAGWDAVAGLKKGYGKELAAEVLVQLNQSDFGAEISQIRAASPQALVMFLPGGSGIAFQRQFNQSGLRETVEPYVATFQADETTFGALGDSALGVINAGPWNPYLDNAANKQFVAAFRAKYGRNPSILAAMAYDTVLMLDAAVTAVGGEVEDSAKFRDALRAVKFESVRGSFAFNNNHFPIQDFYVSRIAKAPDGNLHNELISKIFETKADAHHDKCALK